MSNNSGEERVRREIIEALEQEDYFSYMGSCWDIMLFGILDRDSTGPNDPFQTLRTLYDRYFANFLNRDAIPDKLHPLLKDFVKSNDSKASATEDPSSNKSEINISQSRYFDPSCCFPCSSLYLYGNRAIKRLDESSHARIRTILYADAFWSWFIERTDIDKIAGKILADLEFGGKFPIFYGDRNGEYAGIISQIMISEINKGMSSRRRQRTAVSLKMLGLRVDGTYAGLNLSDMQISPGMSIALQLIAKIENFYNYRRVVQTIEAIAGKKESQQTLASIRTSIELLRRSSEKFITGTNAYNTVAAIVWKLAGFWLVLATSKETGASQQIRFEDIVDTARNTILLNKIGTPSEKSKTKIYLDCANDLTDLILTILSKDETYWNTQSPEDNLKIFLDIVEPVVEHFIASFKEATGIDLTEKKWITDDPVVSHDLPNRL